MAEFDPPRILITNDDGIDAEGLRALESALTSLGEVAVVAPVEPMSAMSHAISLYRPLRYHRLGPRRYAVEGTPVDCVLLALNHLLPHPPELIVSGVNDGANLGQNVFYSGTVAGAVEGTFHGIPSVAVSRQAHPAASFDEAARFVRQLSSFLLRHGLPPGITLNVNVPSPAAPRGARLTRRANGESRRIQIEEESHPLHGSWCRIREHIELHRLPEDSDIAALRSGFISVTPLIFDPPHQYALGALEQWMQGG